MGPLTTIDARGVSLVHRARRGAGRRRTGRNGTDRNGTGRNGTDRDGTGRNGTDRDGTDRNGTDRDDGGRGVARRRPNQHDTAHHDAAERDARAGHGIHSVDLTGRAGEIIGVLGPNGAGKSTLLRVLATATRPTGGTLRLLGHPAVPPTIALRRRIGFAGDEPIHLDPLSGRENARFFARAAGLDAREAADAVDTLLDELGLGPDADRPAGEYSHGMRRKLLLCTALAHSPALLLLDEPTLGLDPPSLGALRGLLERRADRGATIVVATHDTGFAEALCRRVVFLHHGRKVLEGEPAELIRRSGATTRLDVELDAAPGPAFRADGLDLVYAGPDRILVRSDRGATPLPILCARLIEAGAEIRAVRVRHPGLHDAFGLATGAEIEPAGGPP